MQNTVTSFFQRLQTNVTKYFSISCTSENDRDALFCIGWRGISVNVYATQGIRIPVRV